MKVLFSLACLLFATFSAMAQEDTTVIKKVTFPEGYEAKLDAIYSEIGGWQGREDVYYNPTATKPTPVVFNIHGGGWNKGTKEAQGGYNSYFKMGFAVANIEYRLSGQATAPAAVEDVRAAILYVVEHAKEFNIDPNKIVVLGGSAGGHLALMAGLLQNDNKFDGAYKKVKNYKIVAIIDKYGITDVGDWANGEKKSKSAIQWLGDKAKDEVFVKSVSPIFYVTKASPPVFIVHGDADPTVPIQQSINLKSKLDSVGVKNVFTTISGGLHGKFTKEQNSELSKSIEAFLRELKIPNK